MILTADANGSVDSAYHTLVKHINSPMPIVMVSWVEKFVFNEELLKLKDWVCICYAEYGWNTKITDSHIWGINKNHVTDRYVGAEWDKFDNWVRDTAPRIMFKRELLKKDVTDKIVPIDYPAILDSIPIQTEQEFNSRPVSAAYYFGRGHEERLRLHSDIWRGASKYNYSVGDNIYYLNGFLQHEQGKKYISMHIPHYQRHPIDELIKVNGLAKIGIAPFGAGMKTFRHAEVCANSVMLIWENDLAWSQDWVHGVNCLKCEIGKELETIEAFTSKNELYPIYLEGVKTFEKYRVDRYINEYIMPLINNL